MFGTKRSPGPNVDPTPQNLASGRFLNFSKSLQKMRTANPSEKLSITLPLKLQTEPRGEKHIVRMFLAKKPRCGSDPSTRNLDCLQARHVLCLQARHLLCLQPRHLLCQQTRDLQSAKTSPPHCPHRGGREAATPVSAMPRGCLGRLQISCLLTQQMSWLQIQQTSCLQTQHMSCLQTILVLMEESEKLQPKSWDLGEKNMESFHGRLNFVMKHGRITRHSI